MYVCMYVSYIYIHCYIHTHVYVYIICKWYSNWQILFPAQTEQVWDAGEGAWFQTRGRKAKPDVRLGSLGLDLVDEEYSSGTLSIQPSWSIFLLVSAIYFASWVLPLPPFCCGRCSEATSTNRWPRAGPAWRPHFERFGDLTMQFVDRFHEVVDV